MATDVLKQLDERIQASVARIQQLRKENDQLTQKLVELEKRYADAVGQVKQLNAERQQHENERNDVRNRIEKILTRFGRYPKHIRASCPRSAPPDNIAGAAAERNGAGNGLRLRYRRGRFGRVGHGEPAIGEERQQGVAV